MFNQKSLSKIKNNKILCWRIELNQYSYDIRHKSGSSNTAPDALSRFVCSTIPSKKRLLDLHNCLGHPGFARLYHFIRSRNLPFTSEKAKLVSCACKTCAEVKPRFYTPAEGQLIKAAQPFERLSIDFKGHVKSKNPNLLIVIDEFSRYLFVFPCKNVFSKSGIDCLNKLFCLFGFPSYIHSDHASSFMNRELKSYLVAHEITSILSTPYHPSSNGQCERCVQTVWHTIKLNLHEHSLPEEKWEDVLCESLHAIISLLCLATNDTPHKRIFKFNRRSMTGVSMPTWLLKEGPVYLRKFVQNKGDPLCERVYLLDANPSYAHIRLSNGHESTVSTSDLAPSPENQNFDFDVSFHEPNMHNSINVPAVEMNDLSHKISLPKEDGSATSPTIETSENVSFETSPEVVVKDISNVENLPRRSSRISRPPNRFDE